MIRPFLRYPDKRLRSAAMSVDAIDDAQLALWDDMVETMEAMPGIGLAAPQIGEMVALAIVDASQKRGEVVYLANPAVIGASETTQIIEEASPNLPSASAKIARPDWVDVAFLNREGRPEQRRFEGLWATSVQHQIDHLAGKMYFDRLSKVKRDMLLRRARKGR